VLIGTAVILFYTTVGGFKAVAYSDVLQGVLMFTGLLVLPIVGIAAAGGWVPLMNQLRSLDPALLEPMGSFGVSLAGVLSALSFAGIGLAFLGAPQLLTRFISAKDGGAIADGGLIAVGCIIVFDVGAVLSGMAGRALFPGLTDPETIFPVMSAELFPAIFTGIFLVLVLAAIMSTADSVLILASSSVVRDVVQKTLGSRATEARLTIYGKATTAVIGLVALVFAFGEVRVLFWFVLFAWSGLGAAFTPVVLAALFWKRTTRQGAIAGMVVGFLVTVVWVVAFKANFYDLYEMIPGFITGLATIVVVSLMTGRGSIADQTYSGDGSSL
jgi:sodium/proline symporter